MKWIKCSDRLPIVGQWVLVYQKGGVHGGIEVDTERLIYPNVWSDQGAISQITHWMPLPKPPED